LILTEPSFLSPTTAFNAHRIEQIKKRREYFIEQGVIIVTTPWEFEEWRSTTGDNLKSTICINDYKGYLLGYMNRDDYGDDIYCTMETLDDNYIRNRDKLWG
jgi:GTP-sensing pleiotropic transcriptional regulator CodY